MPHWISHIDQRIQDKGKWLRKKVSQDRERYSKYKRHKRTYPSQSKPCLSLRQWPWANGDSSFRRCRTRHSPLPSKPIYHRSLPFGYPQKCSYCILLLAIIRRSLKYISLLFSHPPGQQFAAHAHIVRVVLIDEDDEGLGGDACDPGGFAGEGFYQVFFLFF